jgi:small subunit ribosomal protein S7
VPVEVPARRARTLAIRWLVEFARNRREKTMAQRLANELLDAQSQQGGAYKRKDDIFRMAQATRRSPTTAGDDLRSKSYRAQTTVGR